MSSRVCPTVIDCDCIENPWANLSAELAEPYVFVSPHIVIVPPPLGKFFTQLGCKRWCYSGVSQAEADLCAIAQTTECATVEVPQPPIVVDPPLPPTGFPLVSVFATEPATSFGEDPGVFNISRTGSLAQPLAVQFTLSGEAQNGVDYETVPYAVTIDAGDSNVDVIVVPMNTGEIIVKSVVLTILGGSNYSQGASASDTVEITPVNCGTPAFRVNGYDSIVAARISALFPNAVASPLPEWDGILRLSPDQTDHRSNASCFAIAGKSIDVVIKAQSVADTVGCPSGWTESLPGQPGCFACVFALESHTFILTDVMQFETPGAANPFHLFVNQSTGTIGDYREYTLPYCPESYLGYPSYTKAVGDDLVRAEFGDVLLQVVAL